MSSIPTVKQVNFEPGNIENPTGGGQAIAIGSDGSFVAVDSDGNQTPLGGGGGGSVESVTGAGPGIVDNTDPANPVINAQFGSDTTVALPNSASALVDALHLELTLTDDAPGSEDSEWVAQTCYNGALHDALSIAYATGIMKTLDIIQFFSDPDTYIQRSAPNTVAIAVGGNQTFFVNTAGGALLNAGLGAGIGYGWAAYTAGMFFDAVTGNTTIRPADITVGNVNINDAGALATNATRGFLTIPSCAGTPTGAPTVTAGQVALVVDTTNNKLYGYYGGAWHSLSP